MDIFILDGLLRRTLVVDDYESFIWTERFSSAGDFQLVIRSTPANRAIFKTGTMFVIQKSFFIMVVEYVEDAKSSDGINVLKVTGPSLEKILASRVAKDTMSNTTTEPKWVLTGTPGAIARQIFHDICVLGNLSSSDIIPYVLETNMIYHADTIAEPTTSITLELDPTTVYQAISDICSLYDLGFRLCRPHDDTSILYFNIYAGCDRTSLQSTMPVVIFSPELENLQDTKEVTTIAEYKNVAYVFSPVGFEVVYAYGVTSSVAGFERRVLMVNASDITSTVPATATAQMIQRGNEELSKNRMLNGFDGELRQDSYVYYTDYNLGDLVEVRNSDGVTVNMRVTEQIFVSDKEGDRSYPTLSINKHINVGAWLDFDYSKVWSDMGATEYWSTQT